MNDGVNYSSNRSAVHENMFLLLFVYFCKFSHFIRCPLDILSRFLLTCHAANMLTS